MPVLLLLGPYGTLQVIEEAKQNKVKAIFTQPEFSDATAKLISKELGIKVTQNPTQVQGRPVWRLQVDGFATRDAALAYSEANKHKLGLKKVWI